MSLRNSVLFFICMIMGTHMLPRDFFQRGRVIEKAMPFFLLSLRFPWLVSAAVLFTWITMATGKKCGDEGYAGSSRLRIMYADGRCIERCLVPRVRPCLQATRPMGHKTTMLYPKTQSLRESCLYQSPYQIYQFMPLKPYPTDLSSHQLTVV